MKRLAASVLLIAAASASPQTVSGQSLADYTAYPAFVSNAVPPTVMLLMAKNHRLFTKAYNDVSDLDGDGTIDATYKDTIDYSGYFDPNKCYAYDSGDGRFEPSALATGANEHYCTSQWSGNFLNWATMARIDILRRVLYGGSRGTDTTTETVLRRTTLPRDAHAWAKAYSGGDVSSLTPHAWASITLCNLNTASTETSSLVYVINGFFPYSASTNNQQCVNEFEGGGALTIADTLKADVQVCVSSLLEANCRKYENSGSPTYKPTGLMQSLGVDRQGTTDPSDDVILMKFGLISGSYGANDAGGVLRSNVTDVNAEIDPNDGTVSSTSKIIKNIDSFVITEYDYGAGSYACASSLCRSWGNPVAEMFFEAIRFFKALGGPTSEFDQGDAGLPLTTEASWADPYASCPYCSKPFVLILSEALPSYDSDHLPGSFWLAPISSSSDVPSVQTLIANSDINDLEGINNVIIGQSQNTYDRNCTSKAGDFASIRGLCAEEPTKQGSYYLAGLAHYGRTTDLSSAQGDQKLTTYAVVNGLVMPSLNFAVGADTVQIVPTNHDGCPDTTTPNCTTQGEFGDNSKGSLVDFQFCQGDAVGTDWTDAQADGFTSCFDIMWDDREFGGDHDLDLRYRIYVKPDAGAGEITVRIQGVFASAGHANFAGYYIDGVTGIGLQTVIVCGNNAAAGQQDCDTPANMDVADNGMADSLSETTFTVGGGTASLLKNPLWYAAKYGAFEDKDSTDTPNQAAEWDENGDGVPDTYFNAENPLDLEAKLSQAFLEILDKASAGSAASVLASSSTGEGALYQAFFFPTLFEGASEIKWTGATQGLFLDQFGNIREDTNGDSRLIYEDDHIVRPRFDVGLNKTVIDRYEDLNADGLVDSATPIATVDLRSMSPIWEAGKILADTSSCARSIITWVDLDDDQTVDSSEQIDFNASCAGKTDNSGKLAPYLRAGAAPYTAANIINFIRGDQISGMRNRKLTVGGSLKVWKMGDPIHAQPIVVGAPAQRYDIIYGDTSYSAYFNAYKDRRHVAYVGANDGMLHAFNAGFFHRGDDTGTPDVEHGYFTTTQTAVTNTPPLGEELFGFIPQELLPHLRWLTQTDYTHVYYVDLTPKVTDVRIFTPDADHPEGWGTILMGGFRLGGSCGDCASGSGAPPMTLTGDFDNDGATPDETRTFYSAYFVLDITNPESPDYPKLLWSFSHADLGLGTARPSMLRVNAASSGTTDNTDAKWFMVVGSGPTGFNGRASQGSNLFAIDLSTGPGVANSNVKKLKADPLNSFLSSTVTVDRDFDYRVDVTYIGSNINDGGLPWRGKLYRLTMNTCTVTPCTPVVWGIEDGTPTERQATEILDTFAPGPAELGPVTASPAVTSDHSSKMWIFAGTGRLFDSTDRSNTDTQYFVGVKDSVMNGQCSETTRTDCHDNDLVDVSSAEVCRLGVGDCGVATNQVTGVTGATTFPSLISLVASQDGWFTTLPSSGERAVVRPLAFGGLVLFPTFVPNTDPCSLNGEGHIYALYYLTGSAYSSPVIGTTPSGSNETVNRSTDLGVGMASQAVVHVGKDSSGGKMTAYVQKSSGELTAIEVGTAAPITSRFLSWYNRRD